MRGVVGVVLAGAILAGCAAEPGDGGVDSRSSAAAVPDGAAGPPACRPDGEPALDSAQLDGGFVQIRQGGEDDLLLTGDLLQRVTAVSVGELPATIISQSPHQLRAHLVVPHGTAPGPRAVSVGDGSCATLEGAIELTPIVASATGEWFARGTFESPFYSNDSAAWNAAAAGDTFLMLAGEHVIQARLFIDAGVHIEGAGVGLTIVRGASQSFGGFEFYGGATTDVSAVRNMTILAPDTGYASVALFGAGALEADHLHIEADSGLLTDTAASRLTVDQLELIAPGRGAGIETRGDTTATVSSSSISNAAIGLRFAYGAVTVTTTTIDDCHVAGAWFGTYPDLVIEPPVPTVTVTGTTFADNTQGIIVTRGTIALDTVAITDDPLRTESAQVGLSIDGGAVTVASSTISGQQQQGILLSTATSHIDGSLLVDRTTITRGQVGIDIRGLDENTTFTLRRSTVRRQTSAAVRLRGNRSRFDLGTPASPGRNRLSVRRGFALDDARDAPAPDAFPVIPAVGTTLNGTSYAGQTIPGPTTIGTDLRILSTGTLQF